MANSTTAHSIVAFAIVNLNVPIPLDVLYAMSPSDPLYLELVKAWKEKEHREDKRTALLCCVMANSQGAKTKVEDFMPKDNKTIQDSEAQIKANFIAYNERVKAGLLK